MALLTAVILAQYEGGGEGIGAIGVLLWLAIVIFYIATLWKIFTKAGKPGWASIIPIYNTWVLCEIGGKPGWWFLLMMIPFLGIIFYIIVLIGVAENFGKGAGFAIGMLLLSFIFFPILAFGSAQYRGPAIA